MTRQRYDIDLGTTLISGTTKIAYAVEGSASVLDSICDEASGRDQATPCSITLEVSTSLPA